MIVKLSGWPLAPGHWLLVSYHWFLATCPWVGQQQACDELSRVEASSQ